MCFLKDRSFADAQDYIKIVISRKWYPVHVILRSEATKNPFLNGYINVLGAVLYMSRARKLWEVKTGFTLLEIVVVLSLVLIILSLSTLAFFEAFGNAGLDAAGRDVLATLRTARLLARSAGADQVVSFDLESGSFGIRGREAKKAPAGIRIRIMDPIRGMVSSGTYPIKFYSAGEVDGGPILLATRKKMIRIYFDPIMGPTMVK